MSRESVERGPTGTFFFLPLSLGRTQPLLERALAEWAGRREVATLAATVTVRIAS